MRNGIEYTPSEHASSLRRIASAYEIYVGRSIHGQYVLPQGLLKEWETLWIYFGRCARIELSDARERSVCEYDFNKKADVELKQLSAGASWSICLGLFWRFAQSTLPFGARLSYTSRRKVT